MWGDYSGATVEPVEEAVESATEIEVSDSMMTVSSSVTKDATEGFYSFANVANGMDGILIDNSVTEQMAAKDMFSISLMFRATNNTSTSENAGMPLFFCRNSNSSTPYSGILAFINTAPYDNIRIQIRDASKTIRNYQVDSDINWLDGEWHTLEVSCGQTAASRISVSVDGVNYVDTSCGVAAVLNTNMPMCIGRAYDSTLWTKFTGDIKDIHLENSKGTVDIVSNTPNGKATEYKIKGYEDYKIQSGIPDQIASVCAAKSSSVSTSF